MTLDSKNKKCAGGIPAILSTMKHASSEMGLTRSVQTLSKINQKNGFDCPGCAWPEPEERSVTEFCENGAKAIAEEATLARVTPEFFHSHLISELLKKDDYWIGKQGRLTHPMLKLPGKDSYSPVSWEEAFKIIAQELNSLESPNEATFYTSGRTSNEAAFLYQLFVRLFGTNNLPDCSNMCHESSGVGLMESIGFGKGSVKLEDFEKADCILVIGQNPGTNHPRMLTSLQAAARNGCKIISINPLQEVGLSRFKHPQEVFQMLGHGTPLASVWLPVKINGDVALLKGLMKAMASKETLSPGSVFDYKFIKEYTDGFDSFLKDLHETPWDLIVDESGISKEEIESTAEILAHSKRMIVCWAMGLTQHKNAVANIQEAVNLLLLGGHLGREGAGACPVRGHSNVQGDRTMGIYEKMPESFLASLEREFKYPIPREHGLDTVDSIQAMHEGRIKVFFGMGGNFLSATPDTDYVAQALSNCTLTVHVSTKLNRSHLITGKTAVILPCLGRTEIDIQKSGPQFITVENSMGVVHSSKGVLKPGSPQLKSEVAIVSEMAEAVFQGHPEKGNLVPWKSLTENYDRIRDLISKVIPGFDHYNLRVRQPNGFYLPHPVRDRLEFRTSTGKAHFTVHPIEKVNLPVDQFLLMTIRSHDQFNTTLYGLDDRYRGIVGQRKILFMNPDDISVAEFESGMEVDIQSHFDQETRIAYGFKIVPYSIPKKCLAAYFPETNVLVPIKSTAEKSNTPTYKSIRVSLAKAR